MPARRLAAISFSLSEQIITRDGSHPPALQELQLDLDRHLSLSVKGLPRCGPLLQESPTREGILEQCEDAKVGNGTIEVEVAFPEQQPVRISGRIDVYNAVAKNGHTVFWLYAFLPAPVTGTILVPLEVHRESNGRYGWSGLLRVPKIANGAGSVMNLSFRLRRGIFSASCPTGTLQTHGVSRFAGGQVLSSSTIHTCRASLG